MRVLFLDYDGVVNTLWFNHPMQKPNFNFPKMSQVNNTQAIGWLNLLYEQFEYVIVVTSTWRTREDYKECLYRAGLNPNIQIIDKTPWLNGETRGNEIADWPHNETIVQVTDFIILDDDADMGDSLLPFLIQTDTILGLTYYDYEKICNKWKNKGELQLNGK